MTQQVFASASQQADFLSTLSTTASGLSSTAAVALVTSAAAMLNDPTSPLNGDALAAAAARPGDALGDALQRATPGIMYNGTQLRCPERVKFDLVRATATRCCYRAGRRSREH